MEAAIKNTLNLNMNALHTFQRHPFLTVQYVWNIFLKVWLYSCLPILEHLNAKPQ